MANKITIEIEDNLPEIVSSVIDDTKELLKDYHNDNLDIEELPCLNNDLDYDGRVHELIDGSVPVYTKQIEDIWYLHKKELQEAYENAGIGENSLENNGMTAIYCYIQQELNSWYHEKAEDFWNEIKAKSSENK